MFADVSELRLVNRPDDAGSKQISTRLHRTKPQKTIILFLGTSFIKFVNGGKSTRFHGIKCRGPAHTGNNVLTLCNAL